ncbi:MAG TPA: TonB-dependent receptor [Burkholderiales bacterium]|nr:TonB-dependent receptor [Burkholderiales bacterium]
MLARVRWRLALVFNVLFLASAGVGAQLMRVADLADMSIEELGNIQITSVSKHTERLSDAPAAIFVITGDDIHRSGATRLAEALRLAPNLEVARVSASSYAISARGFNNTIANKLLVLIDGRTVYTPLFSGVFWDAQDVMLEDVERIEVISGPGATLWGANAVNGVINVITRRASDTQGAFAYGQAGSLDRGAGARYGGAMGAAGAYRVYARFFDVFNTSRTNGASASDGWGKGQVGFRTDWGTATNALTLQGDAYRGSLDQAIGDDSSISGNNLLGRWDRDLAEWGQLQIQSYFEHTERNIPGTFAEHLNLFDVEFQHGLRAIGAHRLTWGGGYRYGDDRVSNSAFLAFLPANRGMRWANVFAQDEIALLESLRVTLGAKFESNYYTGTEPLPSARLAWKPQPQSLVWGAVSRALRAPSRIDRDFFVTAGPTQLAGGPDFASEVVKVIELGYRDQPSPQATYSVSLFHNIYDRLRSVEPVSPTTSVLGNKMEGTADGLEAWGNYQAARNWRLSAGVFFLRQHLRPKPDSGDPNVSAAGNDPAHQWLLRSSFDLPNSTELDIRIRSVGALPNPSVPAYTAADIRIAWRLQRELELSVVFIDSGHVEFGNPATASEMSSGAYIKLKWNY